MNRLVGFVVLIAIFSNWFDLTRNAQASDDSSVRKLKSEIGVPVVKFLVCQSWGYRKAFEEYAHVIQQRYSGVKVEGGNYPPPTFNQIAASVLSIAKFVMIACLLSDTDPFSMLGVETPGVFLWAKENKVYACFMLFFLGNAIETQFTSTGAFEISINDKTIWSKLQSGRVPRVDELLQIIDANINYDPMAQGNNY